MNATSRATTDTISATTATAVTFPAADCTVSVSRFARPPPGIMATAYVVRRANGRNKLARGPAPAWHQKAAHTTEAQPYIEAAYQIGYEQEMTWAGIATHERARTLKNGLFNAARLHKPIVAVSVEIEKNGRTWQLKFKLHDKRVARAHVVNTYGADRTAWPYDMRAKG
jgi:hypothetical protein